jgi:gliding motility-associated-like protein
VRLFGSGASNYTWDKGVQDGAAFKPMSTQTYTVTGTNPYGCKGQDEVRIDVNPLPDASFAIKKGDLSLQVSANTLSYTNYLFTVYGSGNTYDTSVFQMSYEQGNYYNIELEITDDKGCIAKSLKGINIPFIKMDPSVFIPNAFTPDMNEFNSTFGAVIDENVNITSYHLEIYNRWGELLFTSNNRYVGWDGTYHGRLVASGTYVYKILVEFDESPLFNKSDIFTLLH